MCLNQRLLSIWLMNSSLSSRTRRVMTYRDTHDIPGTPESYVSLLKLSYTSLFSGIRNSNANANDVRRLEACRARIADGRVTDKSVVAFHSAAILATRHSRSQSSCNYYDIGFVCNVRVLLDNFSPMTTTTTTCSTLDIIVDRWPVLFFTGRLVPFTEVAYIVVSSADLFYSTTCVLNYLGPGATHVSSGIDITRRSSDVVATCMVVSTRRGLFYSSEPGSNSTEWFTIEYWSKQLHNMTAPITWLWIFAFHRKTVACWIHFRVQYKKRYIYYPCPNPKPPTHCTW